MKENGTIEHPYDATPTFTDEDLTSVSPSDKTWEPNLSLEDQINRLANFLIEEYGGPTRDEGAVEMAVRLLKEHKSELNSATIKAREQILSRIEANAVSLSEIIITEGFNIGYEYLKNVINLEEPSK